jgi:hypothetical protein
MYCTVYIPAASRVLMFRRISWNHRKGRTARAHWLKVVDLSLFQDNRRIIREQPNQSPNPLRWVSSSAIRRGLSYGTVPTSNSSWKRRLFVSISPAGGRFKYVIVRLVVALTQILYWETFHMGIVIHSNRDVGIKFSVLEAVPDMA